VENLLVTELLNNRPHGIDAGRSRICPCSTSEGNQRMTSALRRRLAAGEVAVGVSFTSGNVHAAEMAAHADLDYVYFDQQHGLISLDTLIASLRAMQGTLVTPLVRVLRNDAGLIGQALDAGAEGVIVPMVNSVEDASAAARASRYQPDGIRSWGPTRATFGLGTDPGPVNDAVLCFVMVETRTGVEHVDEIVGTPGIDGVYVGPADLAVSMGLPPQVALQDGEHTDAVDAIIAACTMAGKACAISGNPSVMGKRGFRMVTAGSDTGFMRAGLDRAVALRRELTS